MRKLTNKQAKKMLAAFGAVGALGSVAGGVALNSLSQPKPVKAAVSAKVNYVKDATFAKGSKVPFDIYYQVPNDKDMTKLVLYDKLEPVFEHDKTRVFNGETDVTDQFKADFDKSTNTTNMTAKDPKKWFGQKLTMRVETTLKDNADLSKYLDKNTNQYNIPNVGDMVVNDKTIPSPPVYVHTPNDKQPTVTKTIQDKDGKWGSNAKYEQGDEYHYQVKYTIPKNGKDITNVQFTDDLEDVLSLENVKVTDDQGNDITKDDGTLTMDKTKGTFMWQPTKDYLVKMPDHAYTVDITTKVKNNVDFSKYLDKASGNYLVPNVAHMKYNDKDVPSNQVTTEVPKPGENKVTKSVKGLSGSFHNDTDNVEVGKDYTYQIVYEPAQGQNLTNVEFTDDLEDVLDLEKVVVKNSDGKDITSSDGSLKLDDKAESFDWQPNASTVKTMGGKKFTVDVTAKVKDGADLQKYIKNNVIQIPNTANMLANGKNTPSNTVTVTPKVDQSTAKKGIVKNPADWDKFFGNGATTAAGQNTDSVTGADKSSEPKAWKDAEKYVKKDSNGQYVKANKDVTDAQFQQAMKALDTVQPSTKVDSNNLQADTKSTTTPTDSKDLKSLINASTVDSNTAARGDSVDYLLTFNIGNSNDMKSLVISDDLENVLDLKNVVIMDSDGINITNDGQMQTSDSDESFTWTAKDPTKYSGKKLYAAVASNIKKDADLSSYDGKAIPNVGHLNINGKDTPTNQVETKLNGNPKAPDNPNSPENPDNPKSPLHGDGTNNPITGKNGALPQTGHFILKNIGWIVSALIAAAAGLGAWLFKKNKADKAKELKK